MEQSMLASTLLPRMLIKIIRLEGEGQHRFPFSCIQFELIPAIKRAGRGLNCLSRELRAEAVQVMGCDICGKPVSLNFGGAVPPLTPQLVGEGLRRSQGSPCVYSILDR